MLCALLVMAVVSACGQSDDVIDGVQEPDPDAASGTWVYLTLNVGVAESGVAPVSRASDPDYYFEEPLRQNEKLNSLYVIIAGSDGTVEAFRRVRYDADGEVMYDNLTFRLTPGAKKIYLIGNDVSLPQPVRDLYEGLRTGDIFPASLLTATLSRGLNDVFFSATDDIPMSETFDITLERPEGNNPAYVSASLFVTRIAVKYTIIAADDLDIIKVRLNNMSTSQYLMPVSVVYVPGKYEPAEVIGGIAGRNITSFAAPADPGLGVFELELTGRTEIEIQNADNTTRKAFRYDPFYLMETPGTKFTISAQGNFIDPDGKPIEGEWLPERTLPNLPLLPRNTHVIVNMSAKADFDCKVDLVPYRGCVLEPWFGLDRD